MAREETDLAAMARHYPLNGIELDLSRYHHRTLGTRDIMVYHIMKNYMCPQNVKGRVLLERSKQLLTFGPVKSQDPKLGLDIQVMSKRLATDWYVPLQATGDLSGSMDVPIGEQALNPVSRGMHLYQKSTTWPFEYIWPRIQEVLLGIVQRFYLEVENPSIAMFLKHMKDAHMKAIPLPSPGWRKDMSTHLSSYSRLTGNQKNHFLFPGHDPRIDHSAQTVGRRAALIEGSFVSLPLHDLQSHLRGRSTVKGEPKSMHNIYCLSHERPRRRVSVPPPGSWGTADLMNEGPTAETDYWIIYFPCRRLADLDKMSRRRSLSRTHIRAMFRDRSVLNKQTKASDGAQSTLASCVNCRDQSHRTKKCPNPCGYCGKYNHRAPSCPSAEGNRCKCSPFPQYHVADNCPVRCSRRCGNPFHPSHRKHLNALTCTYRCCMCGLRGHTGKECKYKACRCGKQHLGQDCRWKVECAVEGCDRYSCGIHCCECQKAREKGSGESFVGGRCQDCLKGNNPARPRVQ